VQPRVAFGKLLRTGPADFVAVGEAEEVAFALPHRWPLLTFLAGTAGAVSADLALALGLKQ